MTEHPTNANNQIKNQNNKGLLMFELYKKYKVANSNYENLPTLNPLSFILRKAELGHNLTESEKNWLKQHQLFEALSTIENQENYRTSLYKEIHQEIEELRIGNNFIPFSIIKDADTTESVIDSPRALVLYKVYVEERLLSSELCFVNQDYHQYLDVKEFNSIKQKLGITENITFNKEAEKILSKIKNNTPVELTDIHWIRSQKVQSLLCLLKNQLTLLKDKYKVNLQEEDNFDLFYILEKIDDKQLLEESEITYLQTYNLTDAWECNQKNKFDILKECYKATQVQENNIKSHLFKVLKILDTGSPLSEQDINFLKKRKLFETLKFNYQKKADALSNKIQQGYELRPDDIDWCEEHDFKEIVFDWLKKEYQVKNAKYKVDDLLYPILKKLAANSHLTDGEVVWLETEKLLNPSNKIFVTHHKMEAQFNESEFKRTKDYWKLANASAHWRKAEEPENALAQTYNLNYQQIKPAKLKAALLTTRGGALRDINRLEDAEACAHQAIKYFPDSHNPYTLLGALCYDTGRYNEGDRWFDEAQKRGAKPQDQDTEIRRILGKSNKEERQQLIAHLLKKDPDRFDWVKRYKPSFK